MLSGQPAVVFENQLESCHARVVVKTWKAGQEIEIAHDTLLAGNLRIPLPNGLEPGLLDIEFNGDCPMRNCELVFSGGDVHLQLLKGQDGLPRISSDKETAFYWHTNHIIDSLRHSLAELRKLLVVFHHDESLGWLLEQRHQETLERLTASFEVSRKAEGVATASSLLLARNSYIPDWRLPAGEQSREILLNFFKVTNIHDPVLLHSPFFAQKVTDYMSVTSMLSETSKDSALIAGINRFFIQSVPGDTLLKAIISIMRPWLLQNGYDAAAEYLDINYLSVQCAADDDVGLQERLEAYHRVAKGQVAPEIVWLNESNKVGKLSDLPGKDVLIVFWASWCQHCTEAIPAIYQFTVKEGIPVIAIALDKEEEPWEKAIRSMPAWIQLRASGGWNDPWVKLWGVFGTPTIFVLDSNKVIIGKVNKLNDLISLTL
jgi:thiol-disulfide isomerase/thioredoxin